MILETLTNMEYLDILNEDGSPTGKSLPRKEVHEQGLWHRAAHIWIINSQGELLIQKRSLKKQSSPGLWDISAAGHLSAGESSLQGAVKEIKEEIGLSVPPEELIELGTMKTSSVQNNGTYFNNQFNDIYLLEKDLKIRDVVMQESEVDEVKLIPWKELKKVVEAHDPLFVPHDAEYALLFNYLDKNGM
jgi:isopentenyl-diphosphate Delta-isomerase